MGDELRRGGSKNFWPALNVVLLARNRGIKKNTLLAGVFARGPQVAKKSKGREKKVRGELPRVVFAENCPPRKDLIGL